MRRNKKQLDTSIRLATNKQDKALAYYNLGVFHDNNSRELEAIPNYLEAIKLGLDDDTKAKALAWLASSLYKTDKPKEGFEKLKQSQEIATDKSLIKFLTGLEKRIKSKLSNVS